jgi:hypothetical protein
MNRLEYLRVGIISGAKAVCLTSSVFIIIIFVVLPLFLITTVEDFPFDFDDLPYYLILMPPVALIAGVLPAILIGVLLGCLFGLGFPYIKKRVVNKAAFLLISALIGLVIALPLIAAWEAFLRSTPNSGLVFEKSVALAFAPFCLAAGLYVGQKLNAAANHTKV